MFYFIRDRGAKDAGGGMPSRITPLSDLSSNTHSHLRYAGGRTVVRMPMKIQAIQAILLFVELLLGIALLVCGTVKIMARSHLYLYSNAIYLSMLSIFGVFAGLFANRHNGGKTSHLVHCCIGAISCVGFVWILFVNINEIKEDTKVDRPVEIRPTSLEDGPPINMTHCSALCAKGIQNLICKCTFNRDAARAELASVFMIVIIIASFSISSSIAVCAVNEKCGIVHEELREKPPPPVKVPRFRQPMNSMVVETRI